MGPDHWHDFETRIVLVGPDYGCSVIWFSDPVPYEETRLSSDLVRRLTAWEELYYRGLDDEMKWRSGQLRERFGLDGIELSDAVSKEIGPEFEVRLRSNGAIQDPPPFVSDTPATNSAAREAFAFRAWRARDDWARLRRIQAENETGSPIWSAHSASGAIFRPNDVDRL